MCEDDHGLCKRHNRQDGNIEQNVPKIINGQEGGSTQRHSHYQDQNENADTRLAKSDESPQYIQKRIGGSCSGRSLYSHNALPVVTACVAAAMTFSWVA